jgi:hypothetical protein
VGRLRGCWVFTISGCGTALRTRFLCLFSMFGGFIFSWLCGLFGLVGYSGIWSASGSLLPIYHSSRWLSGSDLWAPLCQYALPQFDPHSFRHLYDTLACFSPSTPSCSRPYSGACATLYIVRPCMDAFHATSLLPKLLVTPPWIPYSAPSCPRLVLLPSLLPSCFYVLFCLEPFCSFLVSPPLLPTPKPRSAKFLYAAVHPPIVCFFALYDGRG